METKVIVNERIVNLLLASAMVTCDHQDDDKRCIHLCAELFRAIKEIESLTNCQYYYSSSVQALLSGENG